MSQVLSAADATLMTWDECLGNILGCIDRRCEPAIVHRSGHHLVFGHGSLGARHFASRICIACGVSVLLLDSVIRRSVDVVPAPYIDWSRFP